MSRIEKVARALCLTDERDPDLDLRTTGGIAAYISEENSPQWKIYERKAAAVVAALVQ